MSSVNAPAVERGSLRWYWNRVRVMNPLELPQRAATAVGSLKDQTLDRLGMLTPPPVKRRTLPAPWFAAAIRLPSVDATSYLREADAIAAGSIERLDGRTIDLGSPVDWDAATQAAIDGPPPHDLRFQMELHRHGHLVRLAQAWCLGRDARHVAALLHQLESWLDQCPYPRGVAWSSALDAGLRLLNWSIVWQLLRADLPNSIVPEPLRQRWLASVYIHARFVRQNRSRHSSANNHLIGELIGLVVAEATWPLWAELVSWGSAARHELVVQALRQTHADGVSCEQASWYQTFVFEMLAVFVHIERSRGRPVDERLLRRMGAMAGFIAALRDCRGHLSHHGDADQARALHVDPGRDDACTRMLALAVDLRVAPELRSLVDQPSAVTPWLLGSLVEDRPATAPSREERRATRALLPRSFPQGGYHLLGSQFGEDDEVLLTMDTGALGYLSIAAHGHADALSLRLSVCGQPILVDRGTYAYNAEPAWRRYFRSTLAHNTVCVDGTDQSAYGGPFLWLKHARTQLESFASDDMAGHVEAWHDGYATPGHPLTHRRRVEWHGSARRFIVVDDLRGDRPHDVAIAWHFDPACEVELSGDVVRVRAPGVSLLLRMSAPADSGAWQLHAGDPDGPLGWHSPAFGVRVAAPTLIWRTRVTETTSLSTLIDIQTHQGRL
jgi:Heparinase II/III-like protein/Heparinase II/III N-terminus